MLNLLPMPHPDNDRIALWEGVGSVASIDFNEVEIAAGGGVSKFFLKPEAIARMGLAAGSRVRMQLTIEVVRDEEAAEPEPEPEPERIEWRRWT